MKRRILTLVTLIVLSLAAVACAGRSSQAISEEYAGVAPMPAASEMDWEQAAVAESAAFDQSVTNQLPSGQERLIIRTANMSIVATDTEEALNAIATLANNGGGWVVSSEVYQSGNDTKTGYIQIRIPAEGFQSVLDAISGLAVKVTSLSTSGQDVTEEFVDLSARLGNLEATAARLRTFLDEARNVEEALAVNVELSRVEGEIESLKGRMQYLQQSAAYSSITVNVTPDALAQPIQVGGWQPTGVAKEAVEALIGMLQMLANTAIWLVIFALPVLLVISLPFILLFWLIKRLRRRERERVAATPSTPPPTEE